jgi:PAS domain S-box-containing protein
VLPQSVGIRHELIENAPEGIVLFDHAWRVQRANREFARLFGYEDTLFS